jgi:hypothetical protein
VFNEVTVSCELQEWQYAHEKALLLERSVIKKAKLEEKLRMALELLETTQLDRSEVLRVAKLTEDEFQAGLKEMGWQR